MSGLPLVQSDVLPHEGHERGRKRELIVALRDVTVGDQEVETLEDGPWTMSAISHPTHWQNAAREIFSGVLARQFDAKTVSRKSTRKTVARL